MDLLSMHLVRSNDTTTVLLAGDIDFGSRRRLTEALVAAAETSDKVVVDLDLVTYLDSSGIRALLAAYQEALEHGGTLTVTRPTKNVRQVLDVAGVLALLTDGSATDDADRLEAAADV